MGINGDFLLRDTDKEKNFQLWAKFVYNSANLNVKEEKKRRGFREKQG